MRTAPTVWPCGTGPARSAATGRPSPSAGVVSRGYNGAMLLLLTIVILAVFVGLLVREDIAARPLDWLARRVPPSGVEFEAPPGVPLPRRLSSLIPAGRAWLDDEDRIHVTDGYALGKPLICPPCAAWWLAVLGTVVALALGAEAVTLLAPPSAFILASLVVS